jgi:hypothetical protein
MQLAAAIEVLAQPRHLKELGDGTQARPGRPGFVGVFLQLGDKQQHRIGAAVNGG